jgi:hypothetical protein
MLDHQQDAPPRPDETFQDPPRRLRVLNERQIVRIDRALSDIGPYGEVRLIKAKGRLRFIQWLDSEEAL